LYNDYDSIYGGPAIGWYPTFDKFENMPFVELYEIDTINYTVETRGYFYHFIGQYNQQELPNLEINSVLNVDEWIPVNPELTMVKMLFSIYIEDPMLTDYYDFPCDSSNILFDENLQVISSGLNDSFKLYPNPANSSITIYSASSSIEEIRVFDINGKILLNQKTNANSIELDVSSFQNGVYFIRCKNEELIRSLKFVKQ
jgi:hypothetical protein